MILLGDEKDDTILNLSRQTTLEINAQPPAFPPKSSELVNKQRRNIVKEKLFYVWIF